VKSEEDRESRDRYIRSVNNLDWRQMFYLNLEQEVHPFDEPSRFRPLNRAYDGNSTFWSTPSPEPHLSDAFWQEVQSDLTRSSQICIAAQKLAASILQWQPDPEKIIFVSILRAGVPVTEWLCTMLPGSVGAALSLFVGIGIDQVALAAVERDFPDRHIIFVDGWTGRGGVAREIAKLNRGPLAVLIDPWGWADFSGAREDLFCPSASFTGLATLGFSRTFFVDSDRLFSAYRFSEKFARPEVVKQWQLSSPEYRPYCVTQPYSTQSRLYSTQFKTYSAQFKTDSARSQIRRFHAETPLRVHSNEVCRALINAAPDTLFFSDDKLYAQEHFPLLLQLADQRGVEAEFDVGHLKELKTRVACSLISNSALSTYISDPLGSRERDLLE